MNKNKLSNNVHFLKNNLIMYPNNVSKVDDKRFLFNESVESLNLNGKLILVTSINPTPSGEGKTTVSIGINDCLNFFHKKSIACLRQPSMGPFFGIKGGATGFGKSSLQNSLWINTGFTGDFFAIESANNLIFSIIENEIYQNSSLNIDYKKIHWNRCIDSNDRSLRSINYFVSKNKKIETNFNITAASSLMASFCLANSLENLKDMIDDTLVAFDNNNKPIFVRDLKISDSLLLILQKAFLPNLTFSDFGSPILIHGGPFANIAHGCNSIIATKMALDKYDYVITEAGFGSDLGMEKFLNIKCRKAGITPNLIVLTITIKALKFHSNLINDTNITNNRMQKQALIKGFDNVLKHIEIIKSFNLNFCIVINSFLNDSKEELFFLKKHIESLNIDCEISNLSVKVSQNSKAIFDMIQKNIKDNNVINYTYDLKENAIDKINSIAKKIYGAKNVTLSARAKNKLIQNKNYINDYFICFAKTFYSISGDPKKINWPKNFSINVKDIYLNHSAKFIIPIVGDVFLMPGLPKLPNAKKFIF